jgi:hypothetical protein
MAIAPAVLDDVRRHLDKSIAYVHLARFDWRRQTDALQETFIVARLLADLGSRAVFVDGHIHDRVKLRALEAPDGVKRFFNRRFHDLGFKSRRVLFFDTLSTNRMGGRGSGRARLHFHGVFELPAGWTRADLKRLLAKVFGDAEAMGRRQFHISEPRWDQHHTHNDVQVTGPLGKIIYAIAHAGTTYKDLGLNEGKRSRKSPASRGAVNRTAKGLARGIPSNFNSAIVFCDHISKSAIMVVEVGKAAEEDRAGLSKRAVDGYFQSLAGTAGDGMLRKR